MKKKNKISGKMRKSNGGRYNADLLEFNICNKIVFKFRPLFVNFQVAKALEYLHQQHIIYRDLKSENVLVWSMPQPFDINQNVAVHIKLADYGISRLTLPSGTKGFGGTEGFMAPEIMRFVFFSLTIYRSNAHEELKISFQ